jgi:hypothetical protein
VTRVVTMEEVVEAIEREVRRLGNVWLLQERLVYMEVVHFLKHSNLGREAIEVYVHRYKLAVSGAEDWNVVPERESPDDLPALLVIEEEGET